MTCSCATYPTERQRQVLRQLATTRPTIRELGDALGINSTNGVADHLKALRRKGLVTWRPGKMRTLELTEAGRSYL